MSEIHYYSVNAEWKKDRIGEITSGEFTPVTVATPPEFAKGVAGLWSPEHLFVSAVNVCLMTTFLAIADNSNFRFAAYSSEGTGKLERVDKKYRITEITLRPRITLFNEADSERALRLIDKAEQHCLISNSIVSTIHLEPQILIAEEA